MIAKAPGPALSRRKPGGGTAGSALDTAAVKAALHLSGGSETGENWRKSILGKSLLFTGFHDERLKPPHRSYRGRLLRGFPDRGKPTSRSLSSPGTANRFIIFPARA